MHRCRPRCWGVGFESHIALLRERGSDNTKMLLGNCPVDRVKDRVICHVLLGGHVCLHHHLFVDLGVFWSEQRGLGLFLLLVVHLSELFVVNCGVGWAWLAALVYVFFWGWGGWSGRVGAASQRGQGRQPDGTGGLLQNP